jgi:hypothetical protein
LDGQRRQILRRSAGLTTGQTQIPKANALGFLFAPDLLWRAFLNPPIHFVQRRPNVCGDVNQSATYFNALSEYKKFIGRAAWCIIQTVTKQRTVRLRKRSSSGMMILVAGSAFVRIQKEQNENRQNGTIHPHQERISQGLPIPKGRKLLLLGRWTVKDLGAEHSEEFQREG